MAVAVLTMLTSNAFALPFIPESVFDIRGDVYYNDSILSATAVTSFDDAFASHNSGIFSALSDTTPLAILNNWTFAPVNSSPVDLFSFIQSGITYTFTAVSDTITLQSNQFLDIDVLGTLSASSTYATTAAELLYDSQAFTTGNETFSGSIETNPVPEPGTMVLFGAGFLCLAIYIKRCGRQDKFPSRVIES